MQDRIRYLCSRELLPMVEAALAANGYTIDLPWQTDVSGAGALVMRRGSAVLLLMSVPDSDLAEVDVWGEARFVTAQLLESLPIEFQREEAVSVLR